MEVITGVGKKKDADR